MSLPQGLIVDANEAWRPENVEANLAACLRAGVALIEQPLPAELQGKLETSGESNLRGHIQGQSETEEGSGSSAYVPPEAKDDIHQDYKQLSKPNALGQVVVFTPEGYPPPAEIRLGS